MKLTVIKCGLFFWTGKRGGWTSEYPEAKKLTNWPSLKQIEKATFEAVAVGFGNALSVYLNYGLATQDRFQFVNAIRNEGVCVSEYQAVRS